MQTQVRSQTGVITETINGIVDRVTYHNPDNGWSVLRVLPFNNSHQQETVIIHQTKVFAGATMEFHGAWTPGHITKEYLDVFAMKNLRRFVTTGGKVAFEPNLKINSY